MSSFTWEPESCPESSKELEPGPESLAPGAGFKAREKIAKFAMNTKNRGNYLVGFFALGGSFAPMVGLALSQWRLDRIEQ